MSGKSRETAKAQLAVALAQGVRTLRWARSYGVPSSTAYTWAKDPIVCKAVESWRRRTIDQAISLMTNRSTWAAEVIAMIASEAESDSIRRRAFQAIVTDTMAASEYSKLEARMAKIDARPGERARSADTREGRIH